MKPRYTNKYISYSDYNLTENRLDRFSTVLTLCSAELEFLFLSVRKRFLLLSHTLYYTVQMCIKYKVYGLLHICVKQYLSMTVLTGLKTVCMYNVTVFFTFVVVFTVSPKLG